MTKTPLYSSAALLIIYNIIFLYSIIFYSLFLSSGFSSAGKTASGFRVSGELFSHPDQVSYADAWKDPVIAGAFKIINVSIYITEKLCYTEIAARPGTPALKQSIL